MMISSIYILTALLLAVTVVSHGKPPQPEDIGTNFFLKASKSVPRIGRRTMEFENYFLKASKSIPRIGRRTVTSTEPDNGNSWFSKDPGETAKRSYFEKYLKENDQPEWRDLEKTYLNYPGTFQDEQDFDQGLNFKIDPYRTRVKKSEEMLEQS